MTIVKTYEIKNVNVRLPKNILNHCNQYKDKYVKQASLFAWSCLNKYVDLTKVKFNKNGKPYLIGNKKYISLSHSLNMVAIAISDTPIGIDIETIILITIVRLLAQRLLDRKQLSQYFKSKDNCVWFTKFWTQHEAYVKLLGGKITFSSFNQKLDCLVNTKQIVGKDKRIYVVSVAQKK